MRIIIKKMHTFGCFVCFNYFCRSKNEIILNIQAINEFVKHIKTVTTIYYFIVVQL
ncbi:MAG: hypothetical protein H6Q19_78 [Bacteroidetes bacterium]|nr:hypothetical protein [Bacteroidota bacterium]